MKKMSKGILMTALICGAVYLGGSSVYANELQEFALDEYVVTAARTAHEASEDDDDCTTDIICKHCEQIAVAGNASHTPGADDNNCKTPIVCSVCGKTTTEAKEHDFTGEWQKTEDEHWHICANNGCTVEDSRKAHIFDENGECTCGKTATYVSNEAELIAAIENGGMIMLISDITLTDCLKVTKDTVIDLNGHTITTDNDAFDVWNATLTVSGEGTMTGDEFYGPIQVWGGTVNLLGCTVDGNVWVDEDGGAVHLYSGYVRTFGGAGQIAISGGQVAELLITTAAVTVTGGTVTVNDMKWCENGTLTISGGTFGFDPTAYLADGYTAIEAEGKWTVTKTN